MLPPELIIEILTVVEDVNDLLNCRLVGHSFNQLVKQPDIWRYRSQSRWKRGRVLTRTDDPFHFYLSRSIVDKRVSSTVLKLATQVSGKLPLFAGIRELGDSALDCLEREKAVTREDDEEEWLSRRYWSQMAWDAVLRSNAIGTWRKIAIEGDDEDEDDFEEGLMSFSEFRGVDKFTLRQRYAKAMPVIEEACAPALEITEREPALRMIAKSVASAMETLRITCARPQDYHLLDNHFLSDVWARTESSAGTTTGTLPMTLVSIFCSFCKRLPPSFNVQAKPIGFPGVVLAALANRDEEKGAERWIYFDIYHKGEFLEVQDLRTILDQLGQPVIGAFIKPASAKDMVCRVANNILHSVRTHEASADAMSGALYAAAHSLRIVFPRPGSPYVDWLMSFCRQLEFSADVDILESDITRSPDYDWSRQEDILAVCASVRNEDQEIPMVKLRTERIKWRVGMVFVHKLFGYTAVIRGWDETCEAGEEWIRNMRIDTLRDGRAQPFYHVICQDGSRRYVASENIEGNEHTITDEDETISLLLNQQHLGLYFRTTSILDGRIWFVKSSRLAAEFPED